MRKATAIAALTAMASMAAIAAMTALPSRASDITAGMKCMSLGYTVTDPIYMGRTITGYEQWACASSSGINMKGPPFPVVICPAYGFCGFAGWTY